MLSRGGMKRNPHEHFWAVVFGGNKIKSRRLARLAQAVIEIHFRMAGGWQMEWQHAIGGDI